MWSRYGSVLTLVGQRSAKLTLADRRLFNVLLRHAFGSDLASENRRFEIPLAELRETHDSNDRLARSIEALMTTVVTIQRPDGSTDREVS